jgi:heptose I phosphotransferase
LIAVKKTLNFATDHQLPPDILARDDLFEYLMHIDGQVFRAVATRQTVKVKFGQRYYFIKRHNGVGWLEIFKNWMSFKRPVVSARNEVVAIQALTDLNIPTTPYVADGVQGCVPANLRSFVMTEDLGDIVTLEDIALEWQKQRPRLQYKRALIRRVAEIAGTLHANGIYHRDFYICHFCFKREEAELFLPQLYLLDLHRVEIHHTPSERMQIKDLAALYFSAFTMHLTQRDVYCFVKFYQCELLRNQLPRSSLSEVALKKISKKARSLRLKYEKKISQGKIL